MRAISPNEIDVSSINVATYNADPFSVADTGTYGEIAEALANAASIDVLTADDQDFSVWSARLGYGDVMPQEIYVVNSNYLAFSLNS